MEEKTKISVKEASKITGMPEQFIRIGLQQERIPFGVAVKGQGRWSYHISAKKLEEYIGRKETWVNL